MQKCDLKFSLDKRGRGKVVLGEVDISRFVRGVEIKSFVGGLNEVTLTLVVNCEFDLENTAINYKIGKTK